MKTGLVIGGRAVVPMVIVCNPAPMLKLIVSLAPYAPTGTTSAFVFAPALIDKMASRNETPSPVVVVSLLFVTVIVAAGAESPMREAQRMRTGVTEVRDRFIKPPLKLWLHVGR